MVRLVALATAAFAAAPVLVAAGKASVRNHCPHSAYVTSVGGSDSQTHELQPGAKLHQEFETGLFGGGISVKLSNDNSLSKITQFEYTLAGPLVFYDLSNINGYPFEHGGVAITPSDHSCPAVHCPPNVPCKAAYNTPDQNTATHGCQSSTSLNLELCPETSKPSKRAAHSHATRHAHH